MEGLKKLSFRDKQNVNNDVDEGMKQVYATKKQGLLKSTVATILKNMKQIEGAVGSNGINPQPLKVVINESTNAAILKVSRDKGNKCPNYFTLVMCTSMDIFSDIRKRTF